MKDESSELNLARNLGPELPRTRYSTCPPLAGHPIYFAGMPSKSSSFGAISI